MKGILLILTILSTHCLYSQNKNKEEQKKEKIQVYICYSMTSKRYHYTKDCKGLEKCNDSIAKISIKKSKNSFGRTLCGFETHLKNKSKSSNK